MFDYIPLSIVVLLTHAMYIIYYTINIMLHNLYKSLHLHKHVQCYSM